MAKGDNSGPSGAPQAPKIDQYSVMHRLMDMGGSLAGSAMAPSAMPSQPMGGNINSMPMQRDLMTQNSVAQGYPQTGQIGQAPNSLVPEGVQDMIRRKMTGSNTYGSQ